MARQISEQRKTAYYLGIALMVVGVLLFCSVFFTVIDAPMNAGDPEQAARIFRSSIFRAMGGMALLLLGGMIHRIGARGLAGSGVVFDPDQARQELEPYSRLAGGMVKDAMDEARVKSGGTPEKVVMIKCPGCGKLNEEAAKFCQECGKKL